MKIFSHRIYYKYGEIIKLIPLFDIHIGHKCCDVSALRRFIQENNNKSTYWLLGGDQLDCIIVTDPRYRKSTDATEREEIIDEQIEMLYEILKPIKNNIILIGDGNHELTIIKKGNTNPTKNLIKMLYGYDKDIIKEKYGGMQGLGVIYFENGKSGGGVRTIILRWHHGWGGATTTEGYTITKYAKDVAYYDADIYLYGHTHECKPIRINRFGLMKRSNKLIAKDILLAVCGSYKKSFLMDGTITWEETKGFKPLAIGTPIIFLQPTTPGIKYWCNV